MTPEQLLDELQVYNNLCAFNLSYPTMTSIILDEWINRTRDKILKDGFDARLSDKPNPLNCKTCENSQCEYYKDREVFRGLHDASGSMMSAAVFTARHGCTTHSKASGSNFIIKSVIGQ